jgi:hypothetical protein
MRPFPALCAFACMLTVTACSGGRSSPADVTGDTPSGETRFAQTDAVAPTDQGPDRSDPREDEWQPPPLDVQPPPPDDDGDGIPDSADPFPADATRPGRAMPSTVYMHTASELFSMDVKMYKVTWLGNFQWPDDGGVHKMTDIAIDRWGVLYGVSFDRLYVCHPFTAECWGQGSLPDGFNGLTLVPKGVLGDEDVLIGVSGAGHWFRLEPAPGGTVSVTELGDYGSGYSSSGDAYSIAGVGTFAAVDKVGESHDYLVRIDPANGKVLEEIGKLEGYWAIYGLAGWSDHAFAFDAGGDILIIDTNSGEVVKVISETTHEWWGAGVWTVLAE